MATVQQLDFIASISRLSAQISAQGKYHVFFRYSGHCKIVDVEVHPATQVYAEGVDSVFIPGFCASENFLNLEFEKGELAFLHSELSKLLDVDADGVPV